MLQKKPSALKREHQLVQNMKFLIFFHSVDHLSPPGSGVSRPKSMRIHADYNEIEICIEGKRTRCRAYGAAKYKVR